MCKLNLHILYCCTCSAGNFEYSQFLPLIPCDIVVIHFTYSRAIIIHYIVTIVALNSYLLDEFKIRKIKHFTFISSLMLFFSLCKSKFLIQVTNFLPPEELLLSFFTEKVY